MAGSLQRRRARSPAYIVVAAARARRAMNRSLIVVVALAALAAVVTADDSPRPRLIDFNPWAWLPSTRNRSPSIMDYFFPPSRTPKQSNLEPPADRRPPETTSHTVENTPAPTTIEDRSTTYAKKISTKTKSTAPVTNPTATTPPKTKKATRKPIAPTTVEAKPTQTKTEVPATTKDATVTTYRTPTKHYTIRPVVRTTETPTVQDTETTLNSDSTETVSDFDTVGTTADGPKETAPTLSTADDLRSTDAGTASTATLDASTPTESTEPADSREGYLPLRDKPQQTHVKINEQTKKEVSHSLLLPFFQFVHSLIATTFLNLVTACFHVALLISRC